MMRNLLTLNLQRHAELDLEAFRQEFEAEFKEPEQPEMTEQLEETEEVEQMEEVDETSAPEQDVDTEVEETEIEQPEQTEEVTEQPQKQTREENAAFAEMRRQNEALAKQAALVEKAAAKHGMTVDQYLAAVEEAELEERAKAQSVPAEFLRRQEMMERQLQQMQVDTAQKTYLAEVEMVKSKFGITDQEAENVFRYLGERGLYNPETLTPTMPFEDAYKLANFDTLTQRKIQEAKQADLAAKKKRQSTTAVPHTNASTATNQDEEITDDFVEKRLRERGLL